MLNFISSLYVRTAHRNVQYVIYIKIQYAYTNLHRKMDSGIHLHKYTHTSRVQACIPFAPHAAGTLTSTPSTPTVCGRMNNISSVRQRNERRRKEGEREVVPCLSSCRFMESTEPPNRKKNPTFLCHLPTWHKTEGEQSSFENN